MNQTNVPFPEAGAVRVAANPRALPSLRRAGPPGPNRFDDPEGVFVVRYLADTLRGCLIELLARFRYDPEAEQRIASVEGVVEQDDDGSHPGPNALGDWLTIQQVARCHLLDPDARLISVNDAALLARLDRHPSVRAALDASSLATPERPAELDGATIRLPGAIGRNITQAVSRAIYEQDPRPSGLVYRSRLDDDERCWGIYGETAVRFESARLLSPETDGEAVRSAARLYELALPQPWAPP